MKEPKSLVLARESMRRETGKIVAPQNGVALCLLLVDRSSSMEIHGDAPRQSANELIDMIRRDPGAERTLFGLYTFNDEVRVEIAPTLASQTPELRGYSASNNTALYLAVHEALAFALECRGYMATQFKTELKCAVTVISDGADTASPTWEIRCKRLADTARTNGFSLQAIGLGIDSQELAQRLGFDERLACSEEASAAGIHRSVTGHTSQVFRGTMNFGRSSTPTPSDKD